MIHNSLIAPSHSFFVPSEGSVEIQMHLQNVRCHPQNFKFVLMSYPRRKELNILLKQGSLGQGNKKCLYASTPSEPAQTRPHLHSSNGGFQLLYDSSTMAVVGMIRDLAHTDSLWLANNLQEQIGQTNEEKKTSKQQNKFSLSPRAQCCVASTCVPEHATPQPVL